jgi:hypothetical protein
MGLSGDDLLPFIYLVWLVFPIATPVTAIVLLSNKSKARTAAGGEPVSLWAYFGLAVVMFVAGCALAFGTCLAMIAH